MSKVVCFEDYYSKHKKPDDVSEATADAADEANQEVVVDSKDFIIADCNNKIGEIKKITQRWLTKARRFPPEDFRFVRVGDERFVGWTIPASKDIVLASNGSVYSITGGNDVGELYLMDLITHDTTLDISTLYVINNDFSEILDGIKNPNFGKITRFVEPIAETEEPTKRSLFPRKDKTQKADESSERKDESWIKRNGSYLKGFIIMAIVLSIILSLVLLKLYIDYFPKYNL